MISKITAIAIAIFLVGCAATPKTNEGLTPLTSNELNQTFTGKTLQSKDGSWTWKFGADGFAIAEDKDGNWDKKPQKWSIEDNHLCRALGEKYPCVQVFKIGEEIFFTKPDSNNLEGWVLTAL